MTAAPTPYSGTVPVPSLANVDGAVTLVEGQTFCVSGRSGDVNPDMPHGFFVLDTRVCSTWQLRVNGHRVAPLAVTVVEPFAATFLGRVHPAPQRSDSDLVATRERFVGQGMRERVALTNYGVDTVGVTVELFVDADFADLFEVKGRRLHAPRAPRCVSLPDGVQFAHGAGDFTKVVEVRATVTPSVTRGVLTWTFTLQPGECWEVCLQVFATIGNAVLIPQFRCRGVDGDALPTRRLESWRARLPGVETDHAGLTAAVYQSGEDLGALRIFDPDHPEVPILAAGAPWFMTVFGRDALLTAWMTLIADPSLAEGVLETLARFQGRVTDPQTLEEPGKILHEMRFGTAARPALSSGDVYYGSVDATPLFVMLLGELRRWDLADDVVERLLPHADRGLEWIERDGDRDGDGFIEYARHSGGLVNQGWKDSWDAIRFADGRAAQGPIALCEVQAYVYAAYVARAHFAEEAGDRSAYDRWVARARHLYERFNEAFWIEDLGYYALALDRDKQPVDALASNMGHCLWTGIVDPARAHRVVEHLMSPEMFSGWGVRTLATSMAAYNPVSYHNGSVWPHDNAICASGLMRYGFVEEAHRVIGAQLDAAADFGARLPELFSGFERDGGGPVPYPTSCSPQAWASAAPLLWLRTLLRLAPSAPHAEVRVDPSLPTWLRRLRVDGIQVAGHSLTVDASDGDCTVTGAGHLDVVVAPRGPLFAGPAPHQRSTRW